MSFFTDRVSKLIQTVTEMRESYITMTVNFKNLESSYEKFVNVTDHKIEKIFTENEEIRRRLTSLEGTFDGIIRSSTKEALVNLARERLQNQQQTNLDDITKLLNSNRNEGADHQS